MKDIEKCKERETEAVIMVVVLIGLAGFISQFI
jgi:hypothetical protein